MDELEVQNSGGGPLEQREEQRSERDERGRFKPGNRHRWSKGESGNAKGRRDAMTDLLRRKLDDLHDGRRTRAEAIIDALLDEAAAGSVRAAELIFIRLEGKMPTISSATVDIHVSRSEFFQYEAKVTELQEIAERRGTPISRARAVRLLAASDPRILDVMHEAEDEE
jgi:Family of unknown function (DUF5681)